MRVPAERQSLNLSPGSYVLFFYVKGVILLRVFKVPEDGTIFLEDRDLFDDGWLLELMKGGNPKGGR
jgi:hypothetical protein